MISALPIGAINDHSISRHNRRNRVDFSMKSSPISRLLKTVLVCGTLGNSVFAQTGPIGLDAQLRIDRLAELRSEVRIGAISSYDRSGGNDDGFSGKDSFVRKESGGLVLADLEGPGVIYRLWTPTPSEDVLEFYFDGEPEPRLQRGFRDLFTEGEHPFLQPLAGYGAGGFYSYLPIAFAKSVKILIRADKSHFYQINYARYPGDTPIQTYSGYAAPVEVRQLEKTRRLFAAAGQDVSNYAAPPGAELVTTRTSKRLGPGDTVTLFETSSGGRIAGLRLGPASALAGPARDLVLKMYWDGDPAPAVISPAGDFFGYAWGEPAMRSILAGTADDTNYLYLPMPFDGSARIELVSEATTGDTLAIDSEVIHTDVSRRANEGRFYALWKRENPTTIGEPFTFVDTRGRGHVVGAILQAQGMESGSTWFFEGDDQATIDGELVVHGTGSEDFFNGGWYDVPGRWNGRVSLPLSGSLIYDKPLSRTGGYRFMLGDLYPYREHLKFTIEHAPVDNMFPTDYAAVTYLYSEHRPTAAWTIPPVEERGIVDFDRIVFSPGRNVLIDSFSAQNMTLTKVITGTGPDRFSYLSVRAEGSDLFGPHNLAFRLEPPGAGRYRISIEALKGPDQGIVQIFERERPVGEAQDLYSATQALSQPLYLTKLEMHSGQNLVLFKLVGTNPLSTGLGLDLVNIILDKIE
jgi:hypothetical protein